MDNSERCLNWVTESFQKHTKTGGGFKGKSCSLGEGVKMVLATLPPYEILNVHLVPIDKKATCCSKSEAGLLHQNQ